MDKFAKYYSSEEKQRELSQYVHENFKLIHAKMLSEMRRKLDIEPEMTNQDGYVSLMISLYGRMFNEMVYSLAGICPAIRTKASDIIPLATLQIFLDILQGNNPLMGKMRSDVKEDVEGFKRYYTKHIDELRSVIEALPK